jgi:hypothetical protein
VKLEIESEEEAGRWLGGHRRWQQAIISFFFFTPNAVTLLHIFFCRRRPISG